MRNIIPDRLWIGNAHDIQDVRGVLSLGIRAVVDLAASETPIRYPRDIAYCRLPLNDGSENEPAILRLAIDSAAEFVRGGIRTLVACSAGMSRSPAVVAAALAIVEGQEPDEALQRIASTGPHDISPSLWDEIKQAIRR
jgi:protein-tyrosine phosphatase